MLLCSLQDGADLSQRATQITKILKLAVIIAQLHGGIMLCFYLFGAASGN
jgi:hypothetical protein